MRKQGLREAKGATKVTRLAGAELGWLPGLPWPCAVSVWVATEKSYQFLNKLDKTHIPASCHLTTWQVLESCMRREGGQGWQSHAQPAG